MSILYFLLIILLVLGIGFFFFKEKIIQIFKTKKFLKSTIFLFLSFFVASVGVIYYDYEKEVSNNGKASDIVFILDVSKSMDALDYQKGLESYSRLQVAKDIIKGYILKNPQNRYALTIFSGDFTEVIPFTTDADLFLTFLNNADSSSIIKGGNVIKEAFSSSISRFKAEKTSGAVVVLSDFEFPGKDKNFVNSYLENLNAYKKDIENNKIRVFSIGIGSERGNNIPMGYDMFGTMSYKKDSFGNEVLTKFDKNSFEKFSSILGAISYKLDDISDIDTAISKIKNIPARTLETNVTINADFSRYFMILSYVFLIFYMGFYYLERRVKA